MQAGFLSRRSALLLPLVLAACGGEEERVFEPLRYNYSAADLIERRLDRGRAALRTVRR